MDVNPTSDRTVTSSARVGAIDPDVLRAVLFYLADYLTEGGDRRLEREQAGPTDDPLSEAERHGTTEAECDLVMFVARKAGGDREISRWVSLRAAALLRLLASHPDLLRSAVCPAEDGGMLREEVIAAVAEMDLVTPRVSAGLPDFDHERFRAALDSAGVYSSN
jgi:hypothetical protein